MRYLFLLLFPTAFFAQKIDNMASFRDMGAESYFRFHYDNDYFTSTDRNYTQGYNFEVVLKSLEKNPVNHLFYKPDESSYKFGLSIEHIGFTPHHYKYEEIQYGDRPFASAIMLKSFVIATDTIRKSRLTSSLNVGIIGPGAFGEEMQVGIHEATGNTIPLGWHNQIRNDVVLNYEVSFEKQLYRFRDYFAVQGLGTVRVGTLFTNASVGANGVIGIINSPFSSSAQKKKFALYFYSQPMVSIIGYDATLQGGLFNDKSPYTIASSDVKRVVAQHNYGFVLQTRTLYFEYSRSAITKEFDSGNSAKWGGIRIGFTF
ncbi:MAG: lipid A deacylase LpxR family protein [Flavobacterium sp.]|uniref:lipid A deacylase LpxR family protein n=1 Tax=Flavobacterium sp. TaxID=239 RepID=UPI00120AF7A5|nr:lipid A deacylase LpxR family protein [Flavobacterium sp.]RZJ67633.1 MAG: lipid A deacylase LpxR family protein [Flavobacterium sp.]